MDISVSSFYINKGFTTVISLVMSLLLTLQGQGNKLEATYAEPIRLDPRYTYEIALRGFYGCNSIKNIYDGHDKIHFVDNNNQEFVVDITHGTYEIDELAKQIAHSIGKDSGFRLTANNNTLKCEIKSLYKIDFTKPGSIGRMLGFEPVKLNADVTHKSTLDVQIIRHTNVYVECNIIRGSYRENLPAHILYGFNITVEPGFRQDSVPSSPIYLELNVDTIYSIELRLVNQKGELIDFGEEQVSVQLEIRKNGSKF